MTKERLDQLLVTRGLCESREKAQRFVVAGKVRVNGEPATKPGHRFDTGCEIAIEAPDRFVSRGGLKLQAAFEAFALKVEGLTCMDVGASTGGFTDCLLQHGAQRVYAVDVGKGQLHWKLRQDPRVVVIEGCNARYLKAGDIPEAVDAAVADVSFISLTLILPAITHVLKPGGMIVTLIKPQFEAGPENVGSGGVVRDPAVRADVVTKIRRFGTEALGLEWVAQQESPVKGPAGNIEYLALWRKP